MGTVLFLVVLTAVFAALGRAATPARERLPWTRWSAGELATNVVRGVRVLLEPSPRQRELLESQLAALHRRR